MRARYVLGTMALIVLIASVFIFFGGISGFPKVCAPDSRGQDKKLVVVGTPLTKFMEAYNEEFEQEWKCTTGDTVTIETLYAASGDHMRAIIAGELAPDIIALSNPFEMDAIAAKTDVVSELWRSEFPFDSSPYRTVLVFAVRKGNPKNIKDWEDLIAPDLIINVSDPRICGGGRWVYTGVLGHEDAKERGGAEKYLERFYNNVPQLYHDQGAALHAFLSDGTGDVVVTYEAGLLLELQKGNDSFEIVAPRRTVEVDLPIAVAQKYTDERGTSELARAYVRGLYGIDAQKFIARMMLRPRVTVASDLLQEFSSSEIFMREDVFPEDGSKEHLHFDSGGVFDSLRNE